MLADGPAVSQPPQPQVLAQQLPQAPGFQVSNIVAENQAILRRLFSVSVFCAWKSDYFKCSDGPAVSQPAQPQVLAQQLPQVARFQVSNIVAENKAILRHLSSVSGFCAWKADYFKCSDGQAVSQPIQPQVLAQQLPQVARFQVSNIVAENKTILRRCGWKSGYFKTRIFSSIMLWLKNRLF